MAMLLELPTRFQVCSNSAFPESGNALIKESAVRSWIQPSSAKQGCWVQGGYGVQSGRRSLCDAGLAFAGGAYALEGDAQRDVQEYLWQQFFLDPGQWWDNRMGKSSPGQPDFRHKTSKEGLWLHNCYKPGWVLSRLARWDAGIGRGGSEEGLEVERLSRCCEEEEVEEAVEALDLLVERGWEVRETLVYCVLKKCMGLKDLSFGRRVHALAVRSGHGLSPFLANHLILLYASHNKLEEARQVFRSVAAPNAYMWASIILAHAQHGQPAEAIELYRRMRDSSLKPDNHVFVAVLKACAMAEDLVAGREVCADILASGLKTNKFVGSSLVNMYVKCGSLEEAREVFDSLPRKSVVTWTAMLSGYAQHGLGLEALELYASMQLEGIVPPNQVTFVCLLQACASVRALHQGKQLHAQIQQMGLEADVVIGNCLVDMYSKCGSLPDAHRVFETLSRRDVVTWNAMLAGYAQNGLGKEALALYARMQEEAATPADSATFVSLVQACANSKDLHQGKQLHAQVKEQGLEADLIVGNCLVDMYSKCGSMEDARRVFDGLPSRDVVTWNALITGYTQQGLGGEALALYESMQGTGTTPANRVTYVALLGACASVGAVHQGRQLHRQIRERGLEADVVIGNGLVDMYVKCASLDEARQVFNGLHTRDVVTWNALLNGYAEHSEAELAMQSFKEMCRQGVQPDGTTFICLLVGCSHAGLVNEGRQYFRLMMDEHGIAPNDYHYNCLVDLLARAGHLGEAEGILCSKPCRNSVVGWTSLLSACKGHGDVDRGRRCFDHLITLDPQNGSYYVLLANIYASAGRWDEVDRIESLRKSVGAVKKPAKACIEVNNKVHEFTVGEERYDLLPTLRSVNLRLKEEGGHVQQTELVLKGLSEEGSKYSLCGHAEKLALAYGLLNTPDGTTLLVTKNLRMCTDCHSGTKILSRLEKRDIIVRDAHRVHRFVNGSCSCGDRH